MRTKTLLGAVLSLISVAACVANDQTQPPSDAGATAPLAGSISPVTISRDAPNVATLTASVRNTGAATICVGGLIPFAAELQGGIGASYMFEGRSETGAEKLIAIWPGGEYVWRDRFVFNPQAGEDVFVMGGTERQDREARDALLNGLAAGIVNFVARTTAFVCEVGDGELAQRNGHRIVKFNDVST